MTRPSSGEIDVAIAALRSDAIIWRTAALDMQDAAAAASRQTIPAGAATLRGASVEAAYEALRAKLADRIAEAAANFAAIAAALDTSATAYETEERDNVHRLRGTY